VGTEARIDVNGDFYAPSAFTLAPRNGESLTMNSPIWKGLHYQAAEVARCIADGQTESTIMRWTNQSPSSRRWRGSFSSCSRG